MKEEEERVPNATSVVSESIPHFSVDLSFGGLARGSLTIEIGGFDPSPDGLAAVGPSIKVVNSQSHIYQKRRRVREDGGE